ncbi:cache domain-containing protein [Veronia nyctiphanis]|uniref:cache domain-containing protein n=1 Tax=Veronia nyctiphanis TaxID=1278244 RepID=UPI001F205AA8|nr:cache domain-containing protein [Veronia nyctiphanis]
MGNLKNSFLYRGLSASLWLSAVFTVVLLFIESREIHGNIEHHLTRVKEHMTMNKLLIRYSVISHEKDMFIDFVYESDTFKDLNFAYENGDIIVNSKTIKDNKFDAKTRPWYVCAKSKNANEYCVSDVYQDEYQGFGPEPEASHVITFSYPIYADKVFIGVGVSDIPVNKLDGDNHFLKLRSYNYEKNSEKNDINVTKVITCFLITFLTLYSLSISVRMLVYKTIILTRLDALSGFKRREAFQKAKVDWRTKAFVFLILTILKRSMTPTAMMWAIRQSKPLHSA